MRWPELVRQLDRLNAKILRLEPGELEHLKCAGPPEDNNLVGCARFGYAIFSGLAWFALSHRLPLKLDY